MDDQTRRWIDAARAGDRTAFASLTTGLRDRAVALAYGRLSDFELARDVAQDALLDVYDHVSELRTTDAFFAWFRTVVHKHCDRRYRRKRLDVVEMDDPPDAAAGDEAAALATERATALHEAVAALSEGQRAVVALHYLADQSIDEIASLLEINPNAVKQRLHAARTCLRESEPTSRVRRNDALSEAARASNQEALAGTIQLFLAIRAADVAVVRGLLARNPSLVNAREHWNPQDFLGLDLPFPTHATPLIRAAELGQLELVELLLRYGASVDQSCDCLSQETALWAAVSSDHRDVAALLLQHGADPNRATWRGVTPLQVAKMRGLRAMEELLLAQGALPGRRDVSCWTSPSSGSSTPQESTTPSAAPPASTLGRPGSKRSTSLRRFHEAGSCGSKADSGSVATCCSRSWHTEQA